MPKTTSSEGRTSDRPADGWAVSSCWSTHSTSGAQVHAASSAAETPVAGASAPEGTAEQEQGTESGGRARAHREDGEATTGAALFGEARLEVRVPARVGHAQGR
ncbi:hypothetical protein [Streptomyces lavendulocolor]|uniref:hypothetical protein n=1 Tax=Streptomyces lavendulocolor TaxID=67316 RepID=UPI0031D6AFA0